MFPGFDLFGKFISSYTLAALSGVFAAGIFAILKYKKRTGNSYPMLITLLFSSIGVGVGGSLLYGITNIRYWQYIFSFDTFEELINNIAYVFGGSVFYGGLIGGIIAGMITIKVKKYPAADITDCAAPTVALFHTFGRVGCFLGGCCYGVESDFGFIYHNALIESANGVRRFPVQLFEAGFELILFIVLWRLLEAKRLKGRLFLLYLLIYPVGRFVLEFFRGDEYRGFIFGLSTSQFISVLLFSAAGVGLILSYMREKKRE